MAKLPGAIQGARVVGERYVRAQRRANPEGRMPLFDHLRVKGALIVGVILSAPLWLYQIWAFIAPGLYAREKRWGFIFLGTAVPLFLIGNVLAYLSLGRSMHYLLGLAPSGVSNLIQVD